MTAQLLEPVDVEDVPLDPQDPAHEPDRPASPALLADYGLTPNGEPAWWPPHSAQRGACGEGVCRRCNLAQERAEAWQEWE